MFCPQCKAEYRPGFTRCADCGIDLVDFLPEEEPERLHDKRDDGMKLVPILQTEDRGDVVSIKMALDSQGIEYVMQGETLSSIRLSDPFVLLVRDDDVDRAREALKGIKLNYARSTFNPKKSR